MFFLVEVASYVNRMKSEIGEVNHIVVKLDTAMSKPPRPEALGGRFDRYQNIQAL